MPELLVDFITSPDGYAAAEAMRDMKDIGDRSMRTIGSLSSCRSLLVDGPPGAS